VNPRRVCMRVNNVFTHDLRVRREAQALAEAGFDVTVVADYKPDLGLAKDETIEGVRIKRIAKTSSIPYWSIVRPLAAERADVYHAHDIDSLFPCLAAARLTHKGARVVYDSHELWGGHARDKVHRKRRMLVAIEGPMLRASDALISASPAITAEIVQRHRYRERPAETILNVPRSRSDDELAPFWASREKPNGLIRTTAVSVFQQGRGAIPLIRALHYLPEDYVIELVGPIPQPEYERQMHKEAATFGDRVRFVGMIPPQDIVPRLAASHVSAVLIEPLSLSYLYTAPNKLFDSLMAGTAIVASDMQVISDIVCSERAGEICDVADPQDIARVISRVYARRKEYGSNARTAAARYCWDVEKQRLVSLYRQLTEV